MNAKLQQATATGSLRDTPLAHALLYALQNRLSGLLNVYASSAGDQVLATCQIDASQQPELLLVPGGNTNLARLQNLFANTTAIFAFFKDQKLSPTSSGIVKVDPLTFISQALHHHLRADVVTKVLAAWESVPMTIAPDAPIERLGLESKEMNIIAALRNSALTITELADKPGVLAKDVQRVLYLLAITKILRQGKKLASIAAPPPTVSAAPEKPPTRPKLSTPTGVRSPWGGGKTSMSRLSKVGIGATTPVVPPAPAKLSEEAKKRWEEIAEIIRMIDHQTYFDMLGVAKGAPAAEVQHAYFSLAKTLHPDRLPTELAVLRPQVHWLFAQFTEAYHTLTDNSKRQKYIKAMEQGGGTLASARKLQAVIDAAMAFQKAELHFRRGEIQESLTLLELALSLNDEEAEYHVFLAKILMENVTELDRAEKAARRAVELQEKSPAAHFVLGQILRRHGKEAAALNCFRRVVKHDPRHIEAQRELRLADMRKKQEEKTATTPNIFKKLFKK